MTCPQVSNVTDETYSTRLTIKSDHTIISDASLYKKIIIMSNNFTAGNGKTESTNNTVFNYGMIAKINPTFHSVEVKKQKTVKTIFNTIHLLSGETMDDVIIALPREIHKTPSQEEKENAQKVLEDGNASPFITILYQVTEEMKSNYTFIDIHTGDEVPSDVPCYGLLYNSQTFVYDSVITEHTNVIIDGNLTTMRDVCRREGVDNYFTKTITSPALMTMAAETTDNEAVKAVSTVMKEFKFTMKDAISILGFKKPVFQKMSNGEPIDEPKVIKGWLKHAATGTFMGMEPTLMWDPTRVLHLIPQLQTIWSKQTIINPDSWAMIFDEDYSHLSDEDLLRQLPADTIPMASTRSRSKRSKASVSRE